LGAPAAALLIPCLLAAATLLALPLLALTLPLLALLTLPLLALLTLPLLTRLASGLLARLLTTRLLARLLLTRLIAARLPGLSLLTSPTRAGELPLSQRLHLLAQTLHPIDGFLRLLALVPALTSVGRHLLGGLQVVFKLIQPLGHGRFAHHRERSHALADHLFGLLHALIDIVLLGAARRIAQLFRHVWRTARHGASGLLDVLLQLVIFLAHGFLLASHLLGGSLVAIAIGEGSAHLLLKILLLAGELFSFIRQVAHLAASLLLLHVLHGLGRGTHGLGGVFGVSGRLSVVLLAGGRGTALIALGLLQFPDRLLQLTRLRLAQTAAGEALLTGLC